MGKKWKSNFLKMKMVPALNFSINQKLLFCVLLFCYSCATQATSIVDSSSYDLVKTIDQKAKAFTTDKLGQLYLVTEKNEVIKYDPNGVEMFRFNNNRLGNLQHIDATDPFNVLLYYSDYLTVITLDRTLNQTLDFDLINLNLLEVKAIGMSNDNNVWLYDEVTFKLRKVDRKGQVLIESDQLNMRLFYTPNPNFILERENTVYVNNPETGILVFDIYGKYIKTLDFKGLDDFQVFNKQLIFREGEKLQSFYLQPLVLQTLELPSGTEKEDKIRIQKNRLFVKKADQVMIYKF